MMMKEPEQSIACSKKKMTTIKFDLKLMTQLQISRKSKKENQRDDDWIFFQRHRRWWQSEKTSEKELGEEPTEGPWRRRRRCLEMGEEEPAGEVGFFLFRNDSVSGSPRFLFSFFIYTRQASWVGLKPRSDRFHKEIEWNGRSSVGTAITHANCFGDPFWVEKVPTQNGTYVPKRGTYIPNNCAY